MRYQMYVLTPLAALALAATPVSAQISARVLIDIPIFGNNRGPVVVDRRDAPRYIVVRDYSSKKHGNWKKDYYRWQPITLYVLDGRYYERPYRNARPVSVYYYRDQYFFEPRDRDFYRVRDAGRYDRDDRYRQDDRYQQNVRDNRPGQANGRGNARPDPRYDDRARRRN